MADLAEFPLVPISELTLWDAEGKTIRGRVITKSAMRTYAVPPNGEEDMFCFTFSDGIAKIEFATFGATARQHFDNIALNEHYSIRDFTASNFRNPEFALVPDFDFALNLKQSTVIVVQFPSFDYNIRKIALLEELQDGSPVNVMGVCKEVGDLWSQFATCRNVDFREICLIDTSGVLVKVALWAYEARDFDLEVGKIVYLYGARKNTYNGEIELKTVMNTMMQCESRDLPEGIPGLQELRDWWQSYN